MGLNILYWAIIHPGPNQRGEGVELEAIIFYYPDQLP